MSTNSWAMEHTSLVAQEFAIMSVISWTTAFWAQKIIIFYSRPSSPHLIENISFLLEKLRETLAYNEHY